MNQDTWNTLTAKVAERDDLEARLQQVRAEVEQLTTALEQQIAEFRASLTQNPNPGA